jgi:hypothetical protein
MEVKEAWGLDEEKVNPFNALPVVEVTFLSPS